MPSSEPTANAPAARTALRRMMVRGLAGLAGLLLVRLVLLLFAVRPSNSGAILVLTLTAPVGWLGGWLDRWAGQPQWGARLELATVVALLLVLAGLTGLAWQQPRRRP